MEFLLFFLKKNTLNVLKLKASLSHNFPTINPKIGQKFSPTPEPWPTVGGGGEVHQFQVTTKKTLSQHPPPAGETRRVPAGSTTGPTSIFFLPYINVLYCQLFEPVLHYLLPLHPSLKQGGGIWLASVQGFQGAVTVLGSS